MSTTKKSKASKSSVKVKDLKPSKSVKGGKHAPKNLN